MRDLSNGWGALLAAIAVGIALVLGFIRSLRRLFRVADEILGYDDHPGIARRLSTIETEVADGREDISELRTEIARLRAETADLGRLVAVASAAAEQASVNTSSTRAMMVNHLKEGAELMDLSIAADLTTARALREHGIDVPDPPDYPRPFVPDE